MAWRSGALTLRRKLGLGTIINPRMWAAGEAMCTQAELLSDEGAMDFLQEIGVEESFVRKYVPDLARKPQLQSNVRPLLERYHQMGVEAKSLKAVFKKHSNLVSSYSNTLEDNLGFLANAGLDERQIAEAVKRDPSILIHSVKNVLEPKVRYLRQRGLDHEAVVAIISRNPTALSLDIAKELAPRLDFLHQHCGIDRTYISKTLVGNPMLLSYDVGSRLKPILTQLSTKMQRSSITNLVVCSPAVFSREPEVIEELMSAFKYIGRDQKPWVESMAWGVRYGVDAVRDKIDFLMSLDIPYSAVAQMLKAQPYIFKLDNTVIKLKVDFLVKEMKFDVDELRLRPSYLTKKCMDRVRIRWEVLSLLKSRGIVNKIYFSDLLDLKRKAFVQTFVYKYPDCGRIYFGMRSELKQARAAATDGHVKPSPF